MRRQRAPSALLPAGGRGGDLAEHRFTARHVLGGLRPAAPRRAPARSPGRPAGRSRGGCPAGLRTGSRVSVREEVHRAGDLTPSSISGKQMPLRTPDPLGGGRADAVAELAEVGDEDQVPRSPGAPGEADALPEGRGQGDLAELVAGAHPIPARTSGPGRPGPPASRTRRPSRSAPGPGPGRCGWPPPTWSRGRAPRRRRSRRRRWPAPRRCGRRSAAGRTASEARHGSSL